MELFSRIVSFDGRFSAEIYQIRYAVFVEEQQIDKDLDFDGKDANATHILVYHDGAAIGTARMLEDGHIGRVAVLKPFRRIGVGSCAVNALIAVARQKNMERVYLGSQLHASYFYKKLGFKCFGEVFMEAGIEHVEMVLSL